MKEFWPDILKWGSTIAGAITGFFGEWNAVLTCLLVMNAVDYATGLLCALRGRSTKTTSGGVSSHVGYDGIARKAFIWLVILLDDLPRPCDRERNQRIPDGGGLLLYRE